jgi:preprotein translocase subunit SecD
MKGNLTWRIALTLIVCVLGLVYLLPSFPQVQDSFLGKILPKDQINLGLDLKGGIHLTLGVDTDKAVLNSLEQMGRDIRDQAKDKGALLLKPEVRPGEKLVLTLIKSDQAEAFDAIIKDYDKILTAEGRETTSSGGVSYVLKFVPEYRKYLVSLTVDQAVQTIRNRIDQFGVAEPDIRKQAEGRIQVQLPGLQDPERAIDIIGKTAHLEFRIVREDVNPETAKGALPPGVELLPMLNRGPQGGSVERPLPVDKVAAMTGEHITDAKTQFDSYNQPYVSLTFDSRGAQVFERITGENAKKRMAIVLDGKVYSAPVIQEKISGGRASITGKFSLEEARDLAIVLRAGALPAPVTILEQRTVGPSLGQESIDQGTLAAVVGSALVVVFMVIYYGYAGFVANIALVLNMILILAGMAAFGATLTLPGIAGMVLTIGMAVDANVIIYERVREELQRGLTPRLAIQEGYGRAFLTIFDSNLTTVLAAVILYEYGTGPIRGFAVTLCLGLIASMFTAIFVSRILMDLYVSLRPKAASLSI